MKKALLWVMILLLCVCAAACTEKSDNTIQEDELPTDIEPTPEHEPEMDVLVGEVFEEVSFLYTDSELDMVLVIDSSKWAYTKELLPGSVFFYPQDTGSQTSPYGFAISTHEKTDAPLSDAWETAKPGIEAETTGFEWIQDEPVNVGIYMGERYHFWGEGIKGDYIIWETQNLLYTCCLTAQEADYNHYIGLLLDSLETFYVISEMPYG